MNKMFVRALPILFVIFLVSCVRQSVEPQRLMLISNKSYLPLITGMPRQPFGIILFGSSYERIQDLYNGDFVVLPVDAGILEAQGWEYVDKQIYSDIREYYLLLRGGYTKWVFPTCLPIPRWYWDAWVDEFAIPVIERVGSQRITRIMIMNEPDVKTTIMSEHLGCWGDSFSDGQYYAEFVNHVYGRLKSIYRSPLIVAGQFLNARSDFLDGVADSLIYADEVSFHSYVYCDQIATQTAMESTIVRYEGVAEIFDFPIGLSETSVLYMVPTDACEITQARYLSELVTGGYPGEWVAWFSACVGWQNADMFFPCTPAVTIKPAGEVYINR